jgi:hypothetical protein
MPEANTILNGEIVSLKRIIVADWVGDGTYGENVPLYGVVSMEASVTTSGASRFGDGGQRLANMRRITGATITVEFAGDMSGLATMFGIETETSGSVGDRIRAMRIYNKGMPYFGLVASADLDSGTPNGEQFFAPKCQIDADTIQVFAASGGEDAEFPTVSFEITCLPDENYVEGFTDEEQNLTLGTPTTGTYTLTIGSHSTAAIAYNADAAAIEAALELLPVIGAGNVTVAAGSPGFDITFTGDLASTRLPLMSGAGAGGFDGTIAITRTARGDEGYALIAARYEVEAGITPALPPLFDV